MRLPPTKGRPTDRPTVKNYSRPIHQLQDSPLLTEFLDLINDFISTVITGMGQTFRVLVGQRRTQTLHDGLGRKVFRCNQFQRSPLTRLFLFDQVVHFRIMIFEIDQTLEFLLFDYVCFVWLFQMDEEGKEATNV